MEGVGMRGFQAVGGCAVLAWGLFWGFLAPAQASHDSAAPDELLVAHTTTLSMPWGRMEARRMVAGIHHDLAQAVARRLGWRLRYVYLAEYKGDLADVDRHADLRCGLDPSWTRRPEAYHWSEPLFDTSDQLIGHESAPPLRSLSELPSGISVGTVRSYRYPTLEARFSKGELKREDALDQGSALSKLSRLRTPYAVVSPQVLGWYLRHTPGHAIADWRVKVQQSAYYCGVPQSTRKDAAKILDAVHTLLRDGELQRILAGYAPVK